MIKNLTSDNQSQRKTLKSYDSNYLCQKLGGVGKTTPSYFNSKIDYSDRKPQSHLNSFFNKEIEKQENISKIRKHLFNCGDFVSVEVGCNLCRKESKSDNILKVEKKQYLCGLRFCKNPECIQRRFVKKINDFESIERLKNLNTLWHFTIGFELVDLKSSDFEKIKKQYDRTITTFFNSLKKKFNINIQSFKVLDLTHNPNGKTYIHYHFLAIPHNRNEQRRIMTIIQSQRQKSNFKHKFHIQFHKHARKDSALKYVVLRGIGMYKNKEEFIKIKGFNEMSLIDKIKSGHFKFLSDFIDLEQYYKSFYHSRHFSTIGGLSISKETDASMVQEDMIIEQEELVCKRHGKLNPLDFSQVFYNWNLKAPPDSFLKTKNNQNWRF